MGCLSTTTIAAPPPVDSGYNKPLAPRPGFKLVSELSDEFNGTELDQSKWLDHMSYWNGRGAVFLPSNVSVAEGCLQLKTSVKDEEALKELYTAIDTALTGSARDIDVENWSPAEYDTDWDHEKLSEPDLYAKLMEIGMQAIEFNGQGRVELSGESITLGNGGGGSMNSILVAGGEVIINNALINTQNKRITLDEKAQSLTLKGNIETGGQPTLIGNLGQGALSIYGDRSGGNALIIRDGAVTAFGILSNTGGGVTQVLDKGVLISSRRKGPSIQAGSRGLALREKGVFRLAAPNQIASFVNFAGGKLEMGEFSNDKPVIGNAALNANSVIDFSNLTAESLTIADVSKNTNWKAGAILQIVGFTQGDSLRFGESSNGLTQAQLAAIKFDGKPAKIDTDGYVTPSP